MISVIVPVYNVEKYLKRCVDSIINQSYTDLEIILVDDGSTDNSSLVCDEYACTDKRIKVIHQENMGLSAARNAGIEIATGEFLAFVDSDDYLMHNMYERMLSELKASESDIVMCSYLNINEKGCFLGKSQIIEWTGSGIEFLKTDGLVYNYAWNKLYRRNLFSDIRFPVGKYFEDMYIMHDVFVGATKVSTIPDPLYVYFQREGSISVDLASPRRVDFIEALVKRLEFLLKIDAEEKVIYYYVMQIFGAWNRFYLAHMLDNPSIAEFWLNIFNEFRRVTKGISRNWTLSHRLYLILFRVSPRLLGFFISVYRGVKKVLSFAKRILKRFLNFALTRKYLNFKVDSHLSKSVYKSEYTKYQNALKTDNASLVSKRMEAFNSDEFVLKTNNLVLSDDPCVPTVVVVVRNELERMKLFYEHYRKLGVRQFVVLDNDSTDGTLEFLMEQLDTRVYQTNCKFQTQRKEGWIEKLLAMTGYNRWYIVVDSDELLDYVGSEEHSIESLMRNVYVSGIKRVCGYMLDMYSAEPLFGTDCEVRDIIGEYRYFDNEGYYTKGYREFSSNYILGGSRMRMFGTYIVLSKQSVFYFDEHTLYRDCHSLFPVVPVSEMPTLFVLRHYKFLSKDFVEYQRRIEDKNFYNDSIEYNAVLNQINRNDSMSLYYYKSCEYVNSDSLRCLPYLEEVKW